MEDYQIENFVEALEGLIRQEINGGRPAHNKLARDERDYRNEIIDLLKQAVGRRD